MTKIIPLINHPQPSSIDMSNTSKITPQQLMILLANGELRNGEIILKFDNGFINGRITELSVKMTENSPYPQFTITGFTL